MDVPENLKQGKNTFIKFLSPYHEEINMPVFQKRMKRANNCNASSWNCAVNCSFKTRQRCYKKTVNDILIEALKKYGDTPQMKRAIEERIKEKKRQEATMALGIKKDDE